MPRASLASEYAVRLLRKSGLLSHLDLYPRVRCGRQRLRLPILRGIGFFNLFDGEPWLSRLLAELLPKCQGAFLDVGANLGQTLFKVLALDPKRPYLGCEPNFHCVSYLERLIRLNQLPHCRIYPVALGYENTLTPLNLGQEVDGGASLVPELRPADQYQHRWLVPVYNGDELVEGSETPDIAWIKIDAEGYEWEVLQGLIRTIRRCRPPITCEMLPRQPDLQRHRSLLERYGQRVAQMEELLVRENYCFFRLDEQGRPAALTQLAIPDSPAEEEHLFLPQEHLAWLNSNTALRKQ